MREKKWKSMKKKCFARLGIDEDSHKQRSKRVRFIVKTVESFADSSESGSPILNGYMLNEKLECVPYKYTQPAIPDNLNIPDESNKNNTDLEYDEDADVDENETDDEDIDGSDSDGNISEFEF